MAFTNGKPIRLEASFDIKPSQHDRQDSEFDFHTCRLSPAAFVLSTHSIARPHRQGKLDDIAAVLALVEALDRLL